MTMTRSSVMKAFSFLQLLTCRLYHFEKKLQRSTGEIDHVPSTICRPSLDFLDVNVVYG